MGDRILVSIHYDGQIIKDPEENDIFSFDQPTFACWPHEEMGLEQLKAFILHSIGERRRRVQKLYAILIDEGNGSEAGSQSGGGVSRNIRRLMVYLNRLPEGSSEGSILDSNTPMAEILDSHDESVVGDLATHDYQLNHDSDNDQEDNEPEVVAQGEEDDEEEEDEVEEQGVNYFQWTQPAYAQPEITRQYDHPSHFRSLNLDTMNLGSYGFQGGPDDDPAPIRNIGWWLIRRLCNHLGNPMCVIIRSKVDIRGGRTWLLISPIHMYLQHRGLAVTRASQRIWSGLRRYSQPKAQVVICGHLRIKVNSIIIHMCGWHMICRLGSTTISTTRPCPAPRPRPPPAARLRRPALWGCSAGNASSAGCTISGASGNQPGKNGGITPAAGTAGSL
ncbi:hypothetical protein PIB30_010130 [Stylosanthes scabra]|uniref:Uncharacterized protein n=1 Tax=Stylosanthes scabra TaxID=79078 RepID=A0ABU6Z5W4_9FABA|nr:hypothetical protein [Stylosanthes scabra]